MIMGGFSFWGAGHGKGGSGGVLTCSWGYITGNSKLKSGTTYGGGPQIVT